MKNSFPPGTDCYMKTIDGQIVSVRVLKTRGPFRRLIWKVRDNPHSDWKNQIGWRLSSRLLEGEHLREFLDQGK